VNSAAVIPLGPDELNKVCATSSDHVFCPNYQPPTQTTAQTSTQTTATTTTQQQTTTVIQTIDASTLKISAFNSVDEYNAAVAQLQSDVTSMDTFPKTRWHIQDNPIAEVPWKQLFAGTSKAVSADTASTTQQESKAQPAAVQQQTAAQSTPTCKLPFTTNARMGAKGDWVQKIQQFLNQFDDTLVAKDGIGSKGKEGKDFDQATQDAIKKFQQKYFDDILKPAKEKAPTGFWGPSTRRKANALFCADQLKQHPEKKDGDKDKDKKDKDADKDKQPGQH
jgi:hypothetical protein